MLMTIYLKQLRESSFCFFYGCMKHHNILFVINPSVRKSYTIL